MACPFFMPMEKLENGSWQHAHRLPLGCGWRGQCTAPGHEGENPSNEELTEFCNLGYAERCRRLPPERAWDSVRFGTAAICDGADGNKNDPRVRVRYVCEREHLPVDHGVLEFELLGERWVSRHSDARVQRMAECFLAAYFEKRKKREASVAS